MASSKKNVCCPVETTLRVIGGRWKVLVLHHLMDGTKRFAELHRALSGISHRTLTKQLRELEADGIISRKMYPQVPPKVEYSITPLGKKLSPVLFAMHDWGAEFELDAGSRRRKGTGPNPSRTEIKMVDHFQRNNT